MRIKAHNPKCVDYDDRKMTVIMISL